MPAYLWSSMQDMLITLYDKTKDITYYNLYMDMKYSRSAWQYNDVYYFTCCSKEYLKELGE